MEGIYNRGQVIEGEVDELQQAKDYLWEYIDSHNKELIIAMANTDILKKQGLELEAVSIGYSYK